MQHGASHTARHDKATGTIGPKTTANRELYVSSCRRIDRRHISVDCCLMKRDAEQAVVKCTPASRPRPWFPNSSLVVPSFPPVSSEIENDHAANDKRRGGRLNRARRPWRQFATPPFCGPCALNPPVVEVTGCGGFCTLICRRRPLSHSQCETPCRDSGSGGGTFCLTSGRSGWISGHGLVAYRRPTIGRRIDMET